MKKLLELVNAYIENGLHNSALLLSEFIFKQKQTVTSLYYLIRSLHLQSFNERCITLIEQNPEILNLFEIKVIYFKCKSAIDSKYKNLLTPEKASISLEAVDSYQLKPQAIELLFEALTKEDSLRQETLIKAYRSDTHLLECLLLLQKESLLSKREIMKLINEADPEIKDTYIALFGPVSGTYSFDLPFYSPLTGYKHAKRLYKKRKKSILFNMSVLFIKQYPTSEHAYMSLGLYYLLESNYREARRCFYKAIEQNNKLGRSWLLLGMAYSGMKECENCIACLNLAHKTMIGSYKPTFYLAVEYHRMNNFERAGFYYREALRIKQSLNIQGKYISLLIYYEYYSEALSYLAVQKDPSLGFLRVYCNLFLGKLDEAQKFLKNCPVDWRYYATAGFIDHLMNKLESAADNYYKSLLKQPVKIVEELHGLSIENATCKQTNNVYEYATDLFDTMSKKYSFEVI